LGGTIKSRNTQIIQDYKVPICSGGTCHGNGNGDMEDEEEDSGADKKEGDGENEREDGS
jgi:hypothetical protein